MKPTTSLVIVGAFVLSSVPQPACAQAQSVVPSASVAAPATKTADLRHFLRQSAGDPKEVPPTPATPGMTLIPGGDVVIGTPLERVETLGQKDPVYMVPILAEVPRHTVKVDDFLIDTTEVTNLQWKTYLDATGRKPSETLVEFNWPDGKIPDGLDSHPITNVNILEIQGYLKWCGKRLPNEQEWERAARGDSDRDFAWEGKWNGKLCRSGMDSTGHAEPVGSFPGGASPFGVLDMTGNVAEWVDSKFTKFEGFTPLTITAAKKDRQLMPDFASNQNVIKGGNYNTRSSESRIDARIGFSPAGSDAGVGFRAARSTHPGVDSIRHALRDLQPSQLVGPGLDEKDCFGREDMTYDDSLKVIKGYRVLALAHRGPERGPSLSKFRTASIEEPAALGILYTSEPLKMPDMGKPNAKGQPPMLPPGNYFLSFKCRGESKAHKEKRRAGKGDHESKPESDGGDKSTEKPGSDAAKPADKDSKDSKAKSKDGKGSKDSKDPKDARKDKAGKDDSEEAAAAEPEDAPGAAVPWPGVSSAHAATEDVEYPQDEDLILFSNDNNAVVGWTKSGLVEDADIAPHKAVGSDENRTWSLDFSLDQMSGRRGPRFHIDLELAGPGI